MRWVNLSAWSRSGPDDELPASVSIAPEPELSPATLGLLVEEARRFMARNPSPVLGLLDRDPERQRVAVLDLFAISRHDPKPILFVRSSLHLLDNDAFGAAVDVLALCAGHGDIFWTSSNWLDEAVRARVRQSMIWSYEEACRLLALPDLDDWRRGGRGENVAALLYQAPAGRLRTLLRKVARQAEREAAWPALILLVDQAGSAGLAEFDAVVPRSRSLRGDPAVAELRQTLTEFGEVSMW